MLETLITLLIISQLSSIIFIAVLVIKNKRLSKKFKMLRQHHVNDILKDFAEYGYTFTRIEPNSVYLRSMRE